MGKDYYALLGIAKDANDDEIKRAYRKAAVKWHPDKNPNNRDYAEERFKEVAQAYDVLSDPNKRATYDRYGEDGLKAAGGMPADGGADHGTQYTQMDSEAARRLFEQFFGGFGSSRGPFGFSGGSSSGPSQFQFYSTGPGGGTASFASGNENPFGSFSGSGGNPFGGGSRGMHDFFGSGSSSRARRTPVFGSNDMSWEAGDAGMDPFATFGMNGPADSFYQHSRQQRQRQRPGSSDSSGGWGNPQQQVQQVQLQLSLEELYSGSTKRLKVTRHVLDAASGKSLPVQEVLEIQVKPGWKEGTRITFAGKGDELAPGGPSADLVFVVKQQSHPRFERRGNDLHTTAKVPLVTALTGGRVTVQLLDGRMVDMPVAQPVSHGEVKVLKGEGMPSSKEPGQKGDLYVKVEVVFPKQLSQQQKEQLRHILPRH
jgi:DnaJ family protein B protein 4